MRGGKAFASGGYGCVFEPALACEGQPREPNAVSKLLERPYARKEFKKTASLRAIMTSMPVFFTNRIIVPLGPPCVPNLLSAADLVDVRTHCAGVLTDVDRLNDTEVRQKLRLLNFRRGGTSLENIAFCDDTSDVFININQGLIDLLEVVRYVNLCGMVHADLKQPNLVFDRNDGVVRIIDWGLAHNLNRIYNSLGNFHYLYNAMPSSYLYAYRTSGTAYPGIEARLQRLLREPTVPNAEFVEAAEEMLRTSMSSHGGVATHARFTENLARACNYARQLRGLLPIYTLYKSRAPLPHLSKATSDLLVTHMVTVMKVVFFPNGTEQQRLQKYREVVDTVYRVNQDAFGVLLSYICKFDRVIDVYKASKRTVNILATVAPYLWDPKWAVTPYNLDHIRNDLQALNRFRGVVKPTERVTFAPSNFSYDAAVRAIDPKGVRAFPATRIVPRDEDEETVEMVTASKKLIGVSAARAAAAMPPPPPRAPVAAPIPPPPPLPPRAPSPPPRAPSPPPRAPSPPPRAPSPPPRAPSPPPRAPSPPPRAPSPPPRAPPPRSASPLPPSGSPPPLTPSMDAGPSPISVDLPPKGPTPIPADPLAPGLLNLLSDDDDDLDDYMLGPPPPPALPLALPPPPALPAPARGPACSRKKLADCDAPCSWFRGTGCRKDNWVRGSVRQSTGCSKARLDDCNANPKCEWKTRKGCRVLRGGADLQGG
jgi:hypothetical protein